MRQNQVKIEIAEPFLPLIQQAARYKVYYGGRGAGRSWSFARALIAKAMGAHIRVLCAREFQASIADSVHRLLSDQIYMLGLERSFTILETEIRGANGSLFIFKGLRQNAHSLKSLEGVDVCWIEEAEKISENSWSALTPTIRKAGSEIWVSFNPALETDATYRRFILTPPPDSIVRKVGYMDNPWLPSALLAEAEAMRISNPDGYAHIWGGEPWRKNEAAVLNGRWRVEEFDPKDDWTPHYGADFGFAKDPSTMVKCWYSPDGGLYIEHEVHAHGVGTDELAQLYAVVPGAVAHTIRADSSRPETIAFLNKCGMRVIGAEKGTGSVEDGINWLISRREIVIHPRCRNAIQEARMWSYKVDRVSNDVLPLLVDGNDHIWDAVRYAMEPHIKMTKNVMPRLRQL